MQISSIQVYKTYENEQTSMYKTWQKHTHTKSRALIDF